MEKKAVHHLISNKPKDKKISTKEDRQEDEISIGMKIFPSNSKEGQTTYAPFSVYNEEDMTSI